MSQVHIHPDYDKNKKDNDIAILKLKTCLSFNKNVQPACLWESLDFTGANALFSGWGRFRGRDCHEKNHTYILGHRNFQNSISNKWYKIY